MDYGEAVDFIYGRQLFGIKLGLKNINGLLGKLGNPHLSFKSVHVAGSNGKGSVCSFVSSALMHEGFKVGVYTSPHLVDFRERIKVDGDVIPKEKVASLLERIRPLLGSHTFFEVVTALAFLYFQEEKVDFAVVEVGLGGRLDATNVVKPEVAVITNVSLEHTKHLGETIQEVAFEKAGIIKPGVETVTSNDGEALKVIKNICSEKSSKLHVVKPLEVETSLKGSFQRQNAALAVEALRILGVGRESIEKGVASAKWPGRMHFVEENLLFDCAHNPAGAQALAKELEKEEREIYLVLGIMKDKDVKAICSALEPLAKEVVAASAGIPRAADPREIASFLKEPVIIDDLGEALGYARDKAGKEGLVVLSGSIFTVGKGFEALSLEPFNT